MLWFANVCASVLTFGKGDGTVGVSGFPLAINLNAALSPMPPAATFLPSNR